VRHKAKPAAYLTRIPIKKVENPPKNCAFNLLFFNFLRILVGYEFSMLIFDCKLPSY
jgi:hypothetical protein